MARRGGIGAGRVRFAGGLQTIAHPGFGDDVMRSSVALDLFTQLTHQDSQVLGLLHGIGSPNRGQQESMGDNSAGMAGEIDHQFEFLRSET
jgi:hypothetical protein